MKLYIRILFLLTSILLLSFRSTAAQTAEISLEEKQFNDQSKSLGGECVLIKSVLSVDGDVSQKTFEIDVPVEGEYYLSAWLMNTEITRKNKGLKLFIDNQKNKAGNLNPQEEGWQSSKLKDDANSKAEKLKLTMGKHLLTFCSVLPEVPSIEFIRLSTKEADTELLSTEWTNFIEEAKRNVLPSEYIQLKQNSSGNSEIMKVFGKPWRKLHT